MSTARLYGLTPTGMALIAATLVSGVGVGLARVLPSQLSIYAAHVASIVAGLVAAAWQLRRSVQPPARAKNDLGLRMLWSRPGRAVMAMLVAWLLAWPSVAWTAPWLLTKAFGSAATRTVHATGWHERTRRGRCDRPILRNSDRQGASPAAVCGLGSGASRNWGEAVILLSGRESALGFAVEQLQVVHEVD